MGILVPIGAVLAVAAAAFALLRSPAAARRTPEGQAGLERAVGAVDRELAADLELMAMFDQTKQAFVLENGQFLASRDVIEREAPDAYAFVADVFERIPATEAAMERRGPAGSIAEADLQLIHAWEGDAREAQRALRATLTPSRATRWDALAARLRARFASR
ncbi:MAG: hypothetical protein HYU87_00065 [Chloroflexi bacterium]|nr:hypothetical protein [Chloroflexota bacterium]